MTPADLLGVTFGPTLVSITPDRIAEFVAATGDDPRRWNSIAPPGFAAVLLFAVAGDFLWDDRISRHTRTLLHIDQEFVFRDHISVGDVVEVKGTVTRARERSGAYFVTFEAAAGRGTDAELLTSTSTFLMAAQSTVDPGPDEGEPAAGARATDERPEPALGSRHLRLLKSASRGDLIRYAAVTKDFNPIHWDHESARHGGAPGVIVHGLLMMAWALQAASAVGSGPSPVASCKVRFRNPLRPGEQAVVTASRPIDSAGPERVALAVLRGDRELVSGTASVHVDEG